MMSIRQWLALLGAAIVCGLFYFGGVFAFLGFIVAVWLRDMPRANTYLHGRCAVGPAFATDAWWQQLLRDHYTTIRDEFDHYPGTAPTTGARAGRVPYF